MRVGQWALCRGAGRVHTGGVVCVGQWALCRLIAAFATGVASSRDTRRVPPDVTSSSWLAMQRILTVQRCLRLRHAAPSGTRHYVRLTARRTRHTPQRPQTETGRRDM